VRLLGPKARWVDATKWACSDVEVGVNPTRQPNRVRLDISAGRRVVIPEVVLRGARLAVEVLAGQYLDTAPSEGALCGR